MSSGIQLSYSHGTSATPLLGETIGANLRRMAAAFGDNEAVVDVPTGRRWTYAQFDADTDALARGLLAAGIQARDRVGIWAPNCAEWVLLQYAHREDRRDPGQHQPGLPQPRARPTCCASPGSGCWSARRASRPATTGP